MKLVLSPRGTSLHHPAWCAGDDKRVLTWSGLSRSNSFHYFGILCRRSVWHTDSVSSHLHCTLLLAVRDFRERREGVIQDGTSRASQLGSRETTFTTDTSATTSVGTRHDDWPRVEQQGCPVLCCLCQRARMAPPGLPS